MPKITEDRIVSLPEDRYAIPETSPGIDPSDYAGIFNSAIKDGNTTQYYKFLEEITEKDADVQHSISTRTSEITSKEWTVQGEKEETSKEIELYLRNIQGDPQENLLTVDQLINTFLGPSYLTSISVSEIVSNDIEILGFNFIKHHFLTFYNSVSYPKLWTQETPTGVSFNKEKMIVHYLNPGQDPARGWLGNSVSWQYVLKTNSIEQQLQWQRKYGKGFMLLNMPGERDSFDAAWEKAEELIENLYNVDGAVFPAQVEADYIQSDGANGEYFFKDQDKFSGKIAKIILGQTSTSDSSDSNRSTAEVHKDILETRILQDIELIEDTLTKQLISKIKAILGINPDEIYEFKFVLSELEDEIEEDVNKKEDKKEEI